MEENSLFTPLKEINASLSYVSTPKKMLLFGKRGGRDSIKTNSPYLAFAFFFS